MKGNCFQQTQHTINICLKCWRVIHFVYETLNFVCSIPYILSSSYAQHTAHVAVSRGMQCLGFSVYEEWNDETQSVCIFFSYFGHITMHQSNKCETHP